MDGAHVAGDHRKTGGLSFNWSGASILYWISFCNPWMRPASPPSIVLTVDE
jgi:hypothetical protein